MAEEKGLVKYEAKDGQVIELSRDTIKKYLRVELVDPRFQTPVRPSETGPSAERLSGWLLTEQALGALPADGFWQALPTKASASARKAIVSIRRAP